MANRFAELVLVQSTARQSLRSSPLSPPRQAHRGSQVAVVALSGLLLTAILGVALALQKRAPLSLSARTIEAEGLFNLTNLWTLHLKFASDQWEAMEPKGGFGGPGGGGPPNGGPGGGPPGGPGGFGPGTFLAPVFMAQGDRNQDHQLSREEFLALGKKWFTAWDTKNASKLELGNIRAGLNKTLDSGPPGFPGGRMGGPPLQGAPGKRNGMAASMGIEFKYVQASLEFEDLRLPNVSVRYKGNNTFTTSRRSLKHPLKIDLNRNDRGRRLAGVSKLNLHNNVNDPSWMNEVLSHRLFRDAGVPGPRTAYAQVYITVPGKHEDRYFGLYSLVENVDNDFLRPRFGTRRGALFKPVTRQLFEDVGDSWAAYEQAYDPKTQLMEEQTQQVIGFSKLVSHASDREFAAHLEDYLDLDEFARFMAVTVWLSNMDSILGMGQNFPAEKLARFDKVVAGGSVGSGGFGGGFPGARAEGRASEGPRQGPPGEFGQAMKPIKGFVHARAKSVTEQLAGNSSGATLSQSGPGGPGGSGGFGPGNFLAPALLKALDADQDDALTLAEITEGFNKWFDNWNTDKSGSLSEGQLRAGINKDLAPFRGGPPPGFGPPPDFGEPPDDFGTD